MINHSYVLYIFKIGWRCLWLEKRENEGDLINFLFGRLHFIYWNENALLLNILICIFINRLNYQSNGTCLWPKSSYRFIISIEPVRCILVFLNRKRKNIATSLLITDDIFPARANNFNLVTAVSNAAASNTITYDINR